MQHSTTISKIKRRKRQPNKRSEHLCITCTTTFKKSMEVIAFLQGHKNVTDFIKSLLVNPVLPNSAPAPPAKDIPSKRQHFSKQKGSAEDDKSQIRFYVSKEERQTIDELTERAEYKYYADFLLSQIVPVVEANQKIIDAYLDFTELAQQQTISSNPKTPIIHDSK
ncbi:hypothetical protein V9L05_18185 [Bernardetia sp. Wsw4-3y2]|uniref:hypothetical protein n=1 Tax=Bernardetia sp. Wsw4-3y2 TaxID=3127471 RepID=UPI0030CE98C3